MKREVPGQMRRWVDEMLRGAAGRGRMHMPGHKGVAPFPQPDLYALDTTELDGTDDLFRPHGAIVRAEERYAARVGAGATLFLTGGATAGIHAMLSLWTREGDTVLLSRRCHLSAINACIVAGLKPVWIQTTVSEDGYAYVTERDVLAAIRRHPEASAVLLTHPDYLGGMFPLGAGAEEAHARGMRLLADEAHGAHFPWMEGRLSAGDQGADAWVQSCHKTLPALTGTAVLHLRDGGDAARARALVARIGSTSPSYLLVRSIDDAFAWMEAEGAPRLRETQRLLARLRGELPSMGYADGSASLRSRIGGNYQFDPTRLVIDAPQRGGALAAALAARGWDVEAGDPWRIICIVTAMDGARELSGFADALRQIQPEPVSVKPRTWMPSSMPEQVMTPRQAVMAETCLYPLSAAEGRVTAVSAGLYPPGVPLVVPGERLGRETLELLRSAPGAHCFGLEKEEIRCVV